MATVLKLPTLDDKLRQIRSERYALQSVAKKAIPNERVSKCLRLSFNGEIEVWKHLKTNRSFYNGLLVCGSVWNCPVCAAKISERRRTELQQAFDTWKEQEGKLALLTLTFSHKKTDILKDTLKKFTSATSRFASGKRYNRIRTEMGLIGRIRVFEITWSERNGFHPHIHLALFYKHEVNLNKIKMALYELWETACNKFGLSSSEQYGLDLQGAEKLDEYLSKHGNWSLEQEMSKSHMKKARFESLTPFDFLRYYLDSYDIETNTYNVKYLKLFKEYAAALKGKTQCYWSPGLKKQFNLVEKTDEETAKESLEEAIIMGTLPYEIWKIILKRDLRADFLNWTEKKGFEKAFQFICKFITEDDIKKDDIKKIDKKKEQTNENDLLQPIN